MSYFLALGMRRCCFKAASSRLFIPSTRSSSQETPRKNVSISRFPIPDQSTLSPEIQKRMNEIEEKSSFLPNVFKALAHRPEEFNAFFQYYDILMAKDKGSLTPAEKELIVVATSAANHCLYCVVAHSALHRVFSKNPYIADQVATNPDAANLSDRERAIVRFALDIAAMKPVTDQHFKDLEHVGLNREDAWDIGAIAAFFALSNRMALLTALHPNEEFYLLGRVKRPKKDSR